MPIISEIIGVDCNNFAPINLEVWCKLLKLRDVLKNSP